MNDFFRKECEDLGIDFEEFPYDFSESYPVSFSALFKAMFWLLKKRQDKLLGMKNE